MFILTQDEVDHRKLFKKQGCKLVMVRLTRVFSLLESHLTFDCFCNTKENGFNNGHVIDAGSSSSLQYVANKQGDLVYYNNIGLADDGNGKAGWVYVFPSNDSKEAKTPAKKPKLRSDSLDTNKGLGVVVKIQGTPGDFVLAGLDGNTEVLAVYHPPEAKTMTSDGLNHGWSKFDFGGSLLIDFVGSPTNAIFILKVNEEKDNADEEDDNDKKLPASNLFNEDAGHGVDGDKAGEDEGGEDKAGDDSVNGDDDDDGGDEFFDAVQGKEAAKKRRGPSKKDKLAAVKAQWKQTKPN